MPRPILFPAHGPNFGARNRGIPAFLYGKLPNAPQPGPIAVVTRYIHAGSVGGNGTTSDLTGANAAYVSYEAARAAEYVVGKDLRGSGRNIILRLIQISTGDATGDNGSFANVNFQDADVGGTGGTFLTDATHYVVLEADASVRHAGVQDTGKAYLTSTNKIIVGSAPDYTHFVGLQFRGDVDNGMVRDASAPNVDTWYFDDCLFHSTRATDGTLQFAVQMHGTLDANTNRRIYMRNCVGSGKLTRFVSLIYAGPLGEFEANNCTAVGCTEYVYLIGTSAATPVRMKNNIAELQAGATGTCYYDTTNGVWTTASNISSDTSSLDVAYRSITLTYANRAGYNFALAGGDASAIDDGVSTAAEFWPVVDDIAGTARPVGGSYDIGAFEYSASGSVALETTIRW